MEEQVLQATIQIGDKDEEIKTTEADLAGLEDKKETGSDSRCPRD